MTTFSFISFFLIGLLGGLHCISMCGGVVSAFSAAAKPVRAFPVVVTHVPASQPMALSNVHMVFAYNAGRITSYVLAGALVGGIAGSMRSLSSLATVQMLGYWLTNLMLVALGLYLMDVWRGLAYLEKYGQILWRQIQPMMKLLLPIDNAVKAFALGSLWGWLPCGLVYSVLLTAMFSGNTLTGASVMLAFGLGTLPMMLSLGLLGTKLRTWAQNRRIRIACGALVLAFGVLGLMRANGMSAGFMDLFCITLPAMSALTEMVMP